MRDLSARSEWVHPRKRAHPYSASSISAFASMAVATGHVPVLVRTLVRARRTDLRPSGSLGYDPNWLAVAILVEQVAVGGEIRRRAVEQIEHRLRSCRSEDLLHLRLRLLHLSIFISISVSAPTISSPPSLTTAAIWRSLPARGAPALCRGHRGLSSGWQSARHVGVDCLRRACRGPSTFCHNRRPCRNILANVML